MPLIYRESSEVSKEAEYTQTYVYTRNTSKLSVADRNFCITEYVQFEMEVCLDSGVSIMNASSIIRMRTRRKLSGVMPSDESRRALHGCAAEWKVLYR